ncbi:MAG TPA: riboflavin biosynthesis protein RibF [Microscillaceae bacterium]|jgi:riboflavin kinase/FMN adenylyltransferase|nr:riboflavin biosynthesis protein RibF [Microscillaceae bacterium]
MKVFHGLDSFSPPAYAVVTSGTFDGVHIGHQKILSRLREIAKQHQGETVVITYWPHPRLVVSTDSQDLKLLNTIEEKASLIARQGIDHLVILPFTQTFSQLSPDDFVDQVYVKSLGTARLVIGYDHRFGKDRKGGLDYLLQNSQRLPFAIEEIPRQDIDDVGVSSTKIRQALQNGQIRTANQYLGYDYFLSGKVVRGDQIGRSIGFPTANLVVEEPYKLIPQDGIYAVSITHQGNTLAGMLYIGHRPTLEGVAHQKNIEVNIFDFDGDLYDHTLTLHFIDKIRDDQKFDSLATMQAQLHQDKQSALAIFQKLA